MLYFLAAAALVLLDQVVKLLVRIHIPLGGSAPFLPHILQLTYVQNTGAAFSLLREHTWLLTLISAVVAVLLAVALARRACPKPLGMLSLTLLLAGAVGNLIDRFFLGYVTDMFDTLFWPLQKFPVFNVADICVVVGGVALCLYSLLAHDDEEHSL